MKKIILIILTIISVALLLLFFRVVFNGLFIGGVFFNKVDYESINKIFEKDKNKLFIVSEYFENSGYEEIYIPSSMEEGMMSIGGEKERINEPEVITTIEELKRKGYGVIVKNQNTIYFQRWSNLDCGRGIAYSIDGEKLKLQHLTKHQPLQEENWFYYEEDFNEWKLQKGRAALNY